MVESGKKKILYLHTQPEHYFNLMIDDLNAASTRFFYQAAFLTRGHGWYKELPVPASCEAIFLRVRPEMEKYASSGFRKAHIHWQQDIPPEHYDAVVVAGYAGATQRAIMREFHRRGKPVLMMSDSNIRSEWGTNYQKKIKRCVKKKVLSRILQNVDVLLPTNSLGKAYWRYYGAGKKRIVVSAYYADYARIQAAKQTDRHTVLNQFKIHENKKLILTAARLVPAKGLELMIHAFQQLKLGEKGYVYAIAGTGPLEAELKSLAGSELDRSIFFLGFVQPTDLAKLLVHSELFVLPSRYEPHGIVISEAAAAGTPQLVSDVCGAAKDVIVTGQSGWTFRANDQDDLTRSLKKITEHADTLQSMRQSSRAQWQKWFDRTNPVRVLDNLMLQIVPQ